ncbi:MAG: M48 family metalloprotease [Bacteroidota bacterium]
MKRTQRILTYSLVFLIGFTGLTDCTRNPVTGRREFSMISEAQEIQMGQQYDPAVIAEFGLYPDDALQQFIESRGLAMARASERPTLPWSFKVVDSDVVNAFAVPGGFIYFTRGIMAHFNNEAQFAGVLGHEIGHVTARHTVQQQSKQTLAQLGLIGGMILSPELASQGQSLMQGLQLLFLKFSRDAESQSDQLGVRYSTGQGYDAREMAGFFETLDRLSGGSDNRAPSFLSTHPDPAQRELRVREMAVEAQNNVRSQQGGTTSFKVNRDGYLRMIEGIIYGKDPRQGYVENSVFYHPELRFQYRVPTNWTTINSPQMVQMIDPNQKAVMQLRLSQGSSPEAAAQEFVTQNNLQVQSSRPITINGLNAYLVQGEVEQRDQQTNQVQQVISVESGFIAYNNNVYMLTGMSLKQDFARYQREIEQTINSFATLTDQRYINRQPERLRIASNSQNRTMESALLAEGITRDRLNEFSVLNGILLTEQLPAGALFKVVNR